jgi:pimeloyl-ACP methyl ester carboxylesterase
MPPYTEYLLHTDTADGLALGGAIIKPADQPARSAVVWIHGNTSHFYSYPYVLIGRALAELGILFLAGDTRGAEVAASFWSVKENRAVAGGSAWERYEDSPYDIAAWIDQAAAQGFESVILAGHSQGAAKVTYYLAQRPDVRVAGLVLASPDLYGHWIQLLDTAHAMIADGRGDDLLPPLFDAPWYRLTARNVVSRAEVLTHAYTSDRGAPSIAEVRVPVLALFGDAGDVGGEPELATLRAQAKHAHRIDTRMVPGGDHVYTDREGEVAGIIAAWVEEIRG